MLHDDDGENISDLNPMYCELTAQYWAWKNLEADYYGFCHYRRYFNFSNTDYKEDSYGNVIEPYIDDHMIEKYSLDENTMRKVIEENDIIVTERKDLRKIGQGYESVLSQYEDAPLLHKKDIYTIQKIIKKLYPEFDKYVAEHLSGHVSSFCNMYILKKNIFFDYCQWLFSILKEFCKQTDMSQYSTEALRTPGHLSERLFGIYYLYLLDKNPNIKVKQLQCVFFEHTGKVVPLKPAFSQNSVPIVFAANNNFVPMFAACMQSVIAHSDKKYNYDLVLLHTDISNENQNELFQMTQSFTNISLRFFNVGKLVSNYKLKANAHISVETYYRFLIQDVLPTYKKILYLDCDLIANADVAELYNINVDGYMLAATRDPDFLGQINGANPDTQKYCKEKFHMKNPYNYFQAGVLLFNNEEMKKAHTLQEWLTFASQPYQYNDQDVLNLYCEGKVKYIDMAWNMITDCDHYRVSHVIIHAPKYIQREYEKAHSNPKLIHYAGFMKPWYNPTEDYAHYFWDFSRKTPFYEELLYRMSQRLDSTLTIIQDVDNRSVLRKVVDVLLPKGSFRREFIKRIVGQNISTKI